MTKKERLLSHYSDWLRMRNYSESTYKAYMGAIGQFWKFCEKNQNHPKFDKSHAVQQYLAYRMHTQKRDFSTVNGDYSALQWFYKYILNREWNVRKLIRPKKEKRLYRYLHPEQINKLLECISYQKHKILIMMYYSTGLRLSELRNLEWENIDFKEGLILVKKGKGNKDRYAVLQPEMAEQLEALRKEQPERQQLVFCGRKIDKPLSATSVQWVIKRARRKAGLPEWVTCHVLRHSYATSVLKGGTDLLTLKHLLGHKNIKTTEQYLHLNKSHYKKTYNPLQHIDIRKERS